MRETPREEEAATERQLGYIKRLGYEGSPPRTKQEASLVIQARQRGFISPDIERILNQYRESPDKERIGIIWFLIERYAVTMMLEEDKKDRERVLGYRLHVGHNCRGARKYNGAFVPREVASQYPEVLPPYLDVCLPDECECEIERIKEADASDVELDTKLILKPNKISTFRAYKKHRKKISCITILIIFLVVVFVISLIIMAGA